MPEVDEVERCICAILVEGADGEILNRGSGAFVGDGRHVLTAGHVLRDEQWRLLRGRVFVRPGTDGAGWIEAKIVRRLLPRDRRIDAALLTISKRKRPLPTLEIGRPPSGGYGPLRCVGFPGKDAHDTAENRRGAPGQDSLSDPLLADYKGSPVRLLKVLLPGKVPPGDSDIAEYAARIARQTQGMSGAPLISRNDGRAIGILIDHVPDRDAFSTGGLILRGLGFDTLEEFARDLHSAILPPVAAPRATVEEALRERLRDELVMVSAARARELLAGAQAVEDDAIDGLSQAEVLQHLLEFCAADPDDDPLRVVIGPRGIGKTTLVLSLPVHAEAQRKSGQFPIVLGLLLRHVEFRDEELAAVRCSRNEAAIWNVLLAAWLRYANKARAAVLDQCAMAPDPAEIGADMLRAILAGEDLLIILDGLDDFCRRLEIDLATIRAMVTYVRGAAVREGRRPSRFLLTIADSFPEIDSLAKRRERELLRLGWIGNAAAARLAETDSPQELGRLLAEAGNEQMRTPFMLRLLRFLPPAAIRAPAALLSRGRAAVLDAALAGWGAHARPARCIDGVEVVRRVYAIGYGAFRVQLQNRGADRALNVEAIGTALHNYAQHSEAPESAMVASINALAGAPDAILELIDAPDQIVFERLPDNRILFRHDIWRDHTVGGFLARAVASGDLTALRATTFGGATFDSAAGLLLGQGLPPGLLRQAILEAARSDHRSAAEASGAEFCIGNLIVVLGRGPIHVPRDDLHCLAENFHRLRPLARHVILGVLVGRVIADWNTDPSHADIKDLVVPLAQQMCEDSAEPWISRSLAWMVAQALSVTGAPGALLPYAAKADAETVGLMCPDAGNPVTTALKRATLQEGYVRQVLDAPKAPHRALSVAHYLLAAVLILRHPGVATARLRGGLAEAFSAHDRVGRPALSTQIRDAALGKAHALGVGEQLAQLLDRAQSLYRQALGLEEAA